MEFSNNTTSLKIWTVYRSAFQILGLGLIISLSTQPDTAVAQNACPTKKDLQQGIELRKSTEDTILMYEVKKLTAKQKQAFELEADPLVSDYLLEDFTDGLKGDVGPRYWRRTVSYKGLFTRFFLVDFAANETKYSRSLEGIFPLTVGAQYEIPLQISPMDPPRAKSKLSEVKNILGLYKLTVLGKTKFAIGGCNYDVMILKTKYELSVPEARNVKAVIKYYVPDLGVTILEGSISETGIQVPNQSFKMDVKLFWDKIQKISK